jgi:hypothetical protein
MMQATHIFEEAGLGLAPYKYLGCEYTGRTSVSCKYCYTAIRYKFHLESKDGNRFFVGSDCIFKSGDLGLIDHAKRDRAKLAKQKREEKRLSKIEERQAKRMAMLNQKIEAFKNEHNSMKHIFEWANNSNGIPKDLMRNLESWGSLTGNQISFLKDLYEASLKPKVDCPSGKVRVKGKILSLNYVEGYYGGATLKMTLESEEGYRAYGTVPASIHDALVGDFVEFDALLEPSKNDSSFGFFKRPSKAARLCTA